VLAHLLRANLIPAVERLQFVDRYLPPLLRLLWREQHPELPDAQLPFELGGAAE